MISRSTVKLAFQPAFVIAAVRRAAVSDSSVVAATNVFQNLLRIVNSMLLTRLLTSDAFGVLGIITSVTVTFALLSDIGVTAFVIRHERSTEPAFLNEVWTLRLIRCAALAALVALFSGPIARWLGKPDLQWAIAVGGLSFLLDGVDSMSFFTALRERRLFFLSKLDIVAQVAGIGISVLLAWWLKSYWAIILSGLIGQVFRAWMSYHFFPGFGRRWAFSRARAIEMWSFARFIAGSTVLTLIIGQADKVAFAKLFPLGIFGLYMLGAGLAAAPTGFAQGYAGRVLYPRYAEVVREAPDTLAHEYYAQRMPTHLLYAFGVGGLAGCAPLFVSILYDPRYQAAGFYLQILLISSFFALGTSAVNDVLIALGRAKISFYANLARLGYLLVGGAIGYGLAGPVGLIWAVGTLEVAPQILSWIAVARVGLFRARAEALILLVGATGFAVGWLVDLAGLALRSWL